MDSQVRGKLLGVEEKIDLRTRTCTSRHQKGFRDLLLSSICDGRCHGDGKREGKTRGRRCRWCQNRVEHKHGEDTTMYPGSGLSEEITPLLLLVSSISMHCNYNNCSGEGEGRRGQGSLLLP